MKGFDVPVPEIVLEHYHAALKIGQHPDHQSRTGNHEAHRNGEENGP